MSGSPVNGFTYDVVIVGGSFAGLSAALQLVRARRRVAVVDAGNPRNRHASHSHGVLAQDGRPGSEILAISRQQVAAYPTATFIADEAISVQARDGVFHVTTRSERMVVGKGLVLATGAVDLLPDVPGLTERWGKTVFACGYCHGYEIGGGGIGVLGISERSIHQASLVADWGDVTFFTNRSVELDEAARSMLERRGVVVESTPVAAIDGPAPQIDGVRLTSGIRVDVKALFVVTQTHMASPIAEQLGCAFDDTPSGAIIRTDSTKATSVPGVYAAGDATRAGANITHSSAEGVTAGFNIHQWLIAQEVASP